jgi:antitoxin component of RelBE/YafQ-DinJ toxin-antitoxin module
MKATLNLRLDKSTIEAAKEYALKEGTSISKMVETYLNQLIASSKNKRYASDKLVGILKQHKNLTDKEIKTLYLKDKHHA